jgi:hypothetical protein
MAKVKSKPSDRQQELDNKSNHLLSRQKMQALLHNNFSVCKRGFGLIRQKLKPCFRVVLGSANNADY